jgi:hypothetical protein
MPNVEVSRKDTVNIKTMFLNLKVRDEFFATFVDENGAEVAEYEGYVPSFMPEDHFGDYVQLEIDLDTGQILNWNAEKVHRKFADFWQERINIEGD